MYCGGPTESTFGDQPNNHFHHHHYHHVSDAGAARVVGISHTEPPGDLLGRGSEQLTVASQREMSRRIELGLDDVPFADECFPEPSTGSPRNAIYASEDAQGDEQPKLSPDMLHKVCSEPHLAAPSISSDRWATTFAAYGGFNGVGAEQLNTDPVVSTKSRTIQPEYSTPGVAAATPANMLYSVPAASRGIVTASDVLASQYAPYASPVPQDLSYAEPEQMQTPSSTPISVLSPPPLHANLTMTPHYFEDRLSTTPDASANLRPYSPRGRSAISPMISLGARGMTLDNVVPDVNSSAGVGSSIPVATKSQSRSHVASGGSKRPLAQATTAGVDPENILRDADDGDYLVQPNQISVVSESQVHTCPIVDDGDDQYRLLLSSKSFDSIDKLVAYYSSDMFLDEAVAECRKPELPVKLGTVRQHAV